MPRAGKAESQKGGDAYLIPFGAKPIDGHPERGEDGGGKRMTSL
jgi:hypothetical protein